MCIDLDIPRLLNIMTRTTSKAKIVSSLYNAKNFSLIFGKLINIRKAKILYLGVFQF